MLSCKCALFNIYYSAEISLISKPSQMKDTENKKTYCSWVIKYCISTCIGRSVLMGLVATRAVQM